jgi:hypothetical protein
MECTRRIFLAAASGLAVGTRLAAASVQGPTPASAPAIRPLAHPTSRMPRCARAGRSVGTAKRAAASPDAAERGGAICERQFHA